MRRGVDESNGDAEALRVCRVTSGERNWFVFAGGYVADFGAHGDGKGKA